MYSVRNGILLLYSLYVAPFSPWTPPTPCNASPTESWSWPRDEPLVTLCCCGRRCLLASLLIKVCDFCFSFCNCCCCCAPSLECRAAIGCTQDCLNAAYLWWLPPGCCIIHKISWTGAKPINDDCYDSHNLNFFRAGIFSTGHYPTPRGYGRVLLHSEH